MRLSESAIGKKVGLNDYRYPNNPNGRLSVGEIISEPEIQGFNTYEVMVRWSNGQVSKHPLKRLQEFAEAA